MAVTDPTVTFASILKSFSDKDTTQALIDTLELIDWMEDNKSRPGQLADLNNAQALTFLNNFSKVIPYLEVP